jgi:uncharacterized protein UPF0158
MRHAPIVSDSLQAPAVTRVTACKGTDIKLRFKVMKKIPIHWDDLESAFERNSPDTESFLEVTTGQVVSILQGDPEAASLKGKVAGNIVNYIRVDPASSREQYRWMERFVGSVIEPALRDRLVMAIDGKGAFRRFKDVLLAYPAERERWFTYRADLLHWHMDQWLKEHDIEPTTAPPWGDVKPPPDLAEAPAVPIPHGTEAPGEALRRQARELIDGLPALELTSAIAFLEFLADKSAKATGLGATAGTAAPPRAAAPGGDGLSGSPDGTSAAARSDGSAGSAGSDRSRARDAAADGSEDDGRRDDRDEPNEDDDDEVASRPRVARRAELAAAGKLSS